MKEEMNVIFLDLDGVMNVQNANDHTTSWSKEAIKALAAIIRCTQAKIVLTSSWRYQGIEAMRQLWQEQHFPSEIWDITPLHAADEALSQGAHPEVCKAIEIRAWLQAHPDVTHYVILDDEVDYADRQITEHAIWVSSYRGLDYRCVMEAVCCMKYGKHLCAQWRNLLGNKDAQTLGIGYEQITFGLTYQSEDDMERAIEGVVKLANEGVEQLALCYGLAILITFQTHHQFLFTRYTELCGLLCQIAVDLKEKELAKMLLRISDGQRVSNDELGSCRKQYLVLTRRIYEIPDEEAVDNRLWYLETICELRRHWQTPQELEKDYDLKNEYLWG